MSGMYSPPITPIEDTLVQSIGTASNSVATTMQSLNRSSAPTANLLGPCSPYPPQRRPVVRPQETVPVSRCVAMPLARPAVPTASESSLTPPGSYRQPRMQAGSYSAPAPPPPLSYIPPPTPNDDDLITVQRPKVNYVEKLVDVPTVQKIPVPVRGPVHVQRVFKYVPRVVEVPDVSYVEVPQIQTVMKTVEVPEIVTKEVIKRVPKVEHREVIQEVQKDVVQYVDRFVPVPQPVPTVAVERRVPRFIQQEEPYEVPQVQVVEEIVEVPQFQTVPRTVQVMKPEVVEQIQYVRKPQVQVVERIVEVPEVHESVKVVEVPRIQVVDRVRHVPTIRMENVQLPRSQASFASIPSSPLISTRTLAPQAPLRMPSPMPSSARPPRAW